MIRNIVLSRLITASVGAALSVVRLVILRAVLQPLRPLCCLLSSSDAVS